MNDAPLNPVAVAGHNRPPRTEVLADSYRALLVKVIDVAERAKALPHIITSAAEDGVATDVGIDAADAWNKLDEARKTENEPHLTAQRENNAFFGAIMEQLKAPKGAAATGICDVISRRIGDYKNRLRDEAEHRQREIAEQSRQESQRLLDEAAAKESEGRKVDATIAMDIGLAHQRRAEDAEAQALAPIGEVTRNRSATGALSSAKDVWIGTVSNRDKIDLEKLRPYLKLAELNRALGEYIRKNEPPFDVKGASIERDTKAILKRR